MLGNAEDIKQLGTILCVWAHPDDETFCAAGLLAQAVKNGQQVICLTATKGEAGVYNTDKWPAEQIAEIRENEVKKAMELIGVQHHHWLDCLDGECQRSTEEAIPKILAYLQQYQPNTVITFGPEGLTGHNDHKAVSDWASAAVQQLEHKPRILHVVTAKSQYEAYLKNLDAKLNMYYRLDEPRLVDETECAVCFKLSPELAHLKYQALAVQASQTEKMMQNFDQATIEKAFGLETFIST